MNIQVLLRSAILASGELIASETIQGALLVCYGLIWKRPQSRSERRWIIMDYYLLYEQGEPAPPSLIAMKSPQGRKRTDLDMNG